QLLLVAQLLGAHHLVVDRREDLVGRGPGLALDLRAGGLLAFAHLRRLVGVLGVGVLLGFGHRPFGLLRVALGGLVLVQGGLLGRLAFTLAVVAVVGLLGLALVAAFLVLVGLVRRLGEVVGH